MMSLRALLPVWLTGKTYDTFAEWFADHPEPSLQELVERYALHHRRIRPGHMIRL
jgi:hypothetical protein